MNSRELERANDVFHRIQIRAPGNDAATVLVATAAACIGHARIARGLAEWEAEPLGLTEMQNRLAEEQFNVMATAAPGFAVRSVVTALDLCAAASYRLAGGALKADFEADVTKLVKSANQGKVAVKPAQSAWLTALTKSPKWSHLERVRHILTHRPQLGHAIIGGAKSITSLVIDGTHLVPLDLARDAVAFGEAEFERFCAAVLTDYP